jgi:hypothetical protein
MSLLTLGSVAIGRDLAGLGDPLAKERDRVETRVVDASDQTAGAPTTGQPAATPTASVAGFGQLLVAQIPSEALIAYTTLLARYLAQRDYTFGLWSGCLAVGGGVMMSIITPFLGKGNAATPVPKPDPKMKVTTAPVSGGRA